MKIIKILLGLIFFSSFCLGEVCAQSFFPFAAGEASGSGGTVSYSLGQTSYKTITSAKGTVSQGIQQTYEVSVVSGIEEGAGISVGLAAYPNPASNQLTIEVEQLEVKGRQLHARLYDLSGRLLKEQELTSLKTRLPMEALVPATYMLKVSAGNKEIKVFRILKK